MEGPKFKDFSQEAIAAEKDATAVAVVIVIEDVVTVAAVIVVEDVVIVAATEVSTTAAMAVAVKATTTIAMAVAVKATITIAMATTAEVAITIAVVAITATGAVIAIKDARIDRMPTFLDHKLIYLGHKFTGLFVLLVDPNPPNLQFAQQMELTSICQRLLYPSFQIVNHLQVLLSLS